MKNKKSGFTLIELIISMSLLVLATLILFTAFDTSINIISFSNNKSTLQSECQNIEEILSKIGMQAKSIEILEKPSNETEVTLSSINEEGNSENYIIIYKDNKLVIKKGEDEKTYSNNVEEFSITSNDRKNIFTINMTLSKGYSKNLVSYPVKSTIMLRNKDISN